jgi:hypothetical protein
MGAFTLRAPAHGLRHETSFSSRGATVKRPRRQTPVSRLLALDGLYGTPDPPDNMSDKAGSPATVEYAHRRSQTLKPAFLRGRHS